MCGTVDGQCFTTRTASSCIVKTLMSPKSHALHGHTRFAVAPRHAPVEGIVRPNARHPFVWVATLSGMDAIRYGFRNRPSVSDSINIIATLKHKGDASTCSICAGKALNFKPAKSL